MYLSSDNHQKFNEAYKNLRPIDREYFLDYNKIENPQIIIPNGINIPILELAMKKFGFDLIKYKKGNYPKVISQLKSALNRENKILK